MQIKALCKSPLIERRLLYKTILGMKLTSIILLAGILQVHANKSIAQNKITLNVKNTPLQKVFKEIEKQSGYSIWCDQKILEKSTPVTIDIINAPIEKALSDCLKNQPLEFSIVGKTVIIGLKEKISYANIEDVRIDLKGQVLNDKKEPLQGASVEIKGKKKGTYTDVNGVFELKQVENDATLLISFSGYLSKEINVKGKNFITIALIQRVSPLDQVQVIAYGTTTRRLATGDVTTISSKEIEEEPVNNPLLALEGRVPGLFITQSTGLPGSGVTVRIQGQNSISKGNDPLYVIDGVPYTSQLLPAINGILGSSGNQAPLPIGNNNPTGSPLSFINPSDIESIDILKDADATAIYGSRAANGAILITTKKGKVGQARVNANIQSGWGKETRRLNLLNTQQYLKMRMEGINNDSISSYLVPSFEDNFPDIMIWDTTRYTDWQKMLVGGTAQYTNISASISGGTSAMQYILGSTYHRETTVFPGAFSDQKGSIYFNVNNLSTDQKFHLQFSGNYLVDNSSLPSADLTANAVQLAPDAPTLYNSSGSLNWMLAPDGTSTWSNPLSYIYIPYSNKSANLVGNAVMSYQVLSGLDIKSNLGYTHLQSNEFQAAEDRAVAPDVFPFYTRQATYANGTIDSWIFEPQITYKKATRYGRLEILMGSTFQQSSSNRRQLQGNGYNSDLVLEDIGSAASVTVNSTLVSEYKYNALFGRLNYSWQDKYILSLTTRRDGSSRFGANNQIHDFGSIAGEWIFSQEALFKKSMPFVSFGKVRLSYGTTGNDQIGDYQYKNLYSTLPVNIPYRGITSLIPTGLPNPYLQWEETRKLQAGFDFGLFNDRLIAEMIYFQNRSSNQLLSYSLPITTGFSSIFAFNFPATVQNSGWEISFNTTNIKTSNFSWISNINLTIPKNKLVVFENLASSPYASAYTIGKPITSVKVFHYLGVNPATGLYQFADLHGNPTSSPNYFTDQNVLINTSPTFYGGIYNAFHFKSFELSFLFQFVKQLGTNYRFGNLPGQEYNQPTSILNHWQKTGDVSSIQRFTFGFDNNPVQAYTYLLGSDAMWSDASYIRLKNLSISWQLPMKWRRIAHLENCRIYIQGQNLLTITKYIGLDPETLSSTSLPPLRVLTLGIQVSL